MHAKGRENIQKTCNKVAASLLEADPWVFLLFFLFITLRRLGGRISFVFSLAAHAAALEVVRQDEAKYPAMLFKEQLTAYVEKIYGIVRDNLKKELVSSLALCIKVPSMIVQKIFSQVFSYINVQLLNSLLLRWECCTFSNREYVEAGLAVLEMWCGHAKEEITY
ncbi:hypothetical protein CTI12_AA580780 [Artemisia annua]|uniref:Dilute domain-containing protein n=1 Tax=Artemisia annua TaxID=35608 RepID=A0A2U1KHY9_ARTAN|nr:hypothetical protein CTI12_AA580780 [Artemisia annua]